LAGFFVEQSQACRVGADGLGDGFDHEFEHLRQVQGSVEQL